MNLAEIYLLSSDLTILNGMFLEDFYIRKEYPNHNAFTRSMIFPVSLRADGAFSPVLVKVGRWGRLILFKFTTCTIVFRMAHNTHIKVTTDSAKLKIEKDKVVGVMALSKVPKADDKTYLFFMDPLKCGAASAYPIGEIPTEFSYLGMDILDLSFTTKYIMSEITKSLLLGRNLCVKSFIMDKGTVAWLDNSIATEALFIAGISPYCMVAQLDEGHVGALVKSMKVVYRRAIELVRNDFQRIEKTNLSEIYSTYGREGEQCAVCDHIIIKVILDGLDTYMCPNCQTDKVRSEGTFNG